jgi:hypothetical protein
MITGVEFFWYLMPVEQWKETGNSMIMSVEFLWYLIQVEQWYKTGNSVSSDVKENVQ